MVLAHPCSVGMYGVSQLVDPSMVLLGWFISGMGFVHLSRLEFVSLTFFDLDVLVGSGLRLSGLDCLSDLDCACRVWIVLVGSGLRFSGFECLLVTLTVFLSWGNWC